MKTKLRIKNFWLGLLLVIPLLIGSTSLLSAQCDVAQGGPGYPADPGCETAICAADSFCCDTEWDGICATAAAAEPACAGCLTPPPCDQAQGSPGYPSDAACEAAVCANDSFCCDTEWDGVCAGDAAIQADCCGCVAAPDPTICIDPCDQAQGSAGYAADAGCEAAVCAADSFCCDVEWDGVCAGEAAIQADCCGCVSTPDPVICNPPCDEAQGSAGYAANAACEATVCAADSFCCDTEWDATCASIAATEADCCGCVTTPDPVLCAPPCDEAQVGAGYPTDAACEAAVCANDSFCCETSWDGICAGDALLQTDCCDCVSAPDPVVCAEPCDPAFAPTAMITTTPVTCGGDTDGTATVTLSSGAALSYAWSNGDATATATNLPAGLVSVTVTYDLGPDCEVRASAIIDGPPVLLCGDALSTDVTCFGDTDGTATVFPEGGTPPYTYAWSDGQTTQQAIDLAPGDYTVDVIDDIGCICTSNIITIGEPTLFELDPAYTGFNDWEGNLGNISPFWYNTHSFSILGGTPPYDIDFDHLGYAIYSVDYIAGGATISVQYADNADWTFSFTDANGCEIDGGNEVSNNDGTSSGTGTTGDVLDIDAASISGESSVNADDGAIDITTGGCAGGVASYTWTGPNGFSETTEDISGLSAGLYSVTIECADGQITQGNYWIPLDRTGGRLKTSLETSMIAYPNPFTTTTNIELSGYENGQLTLVSADGKINNLLYEGAFGDNYQYTLDANELSLTNGVYFIVLSTTEETKVERIILNR